MKKSLYLCVFIVLVANTVIANQITLVVAKQVAMNFYNQNSKKTLSSATLAFTETSANGLPDYFVFNMNTNDGFVIVSAEDGGHAIIGYSTERHFVTPLENSNIYSFLQSKKNEIEEIRTNNLIADLEITREWAAYRNNQKAVNPNMNTMSVAALVQSTWDQSPVYNDLCPSGSVTGCVATTMAQIMRFWSYPAMGTGSSTYASNYGTLSVNYGTTTYNWANMPLNSANNDVSIISYHCGVSVEMDYSPSGSGAMVLDYGPGAPSAEYSFKTYFGYDPSTLQGKQKNNYSDAQWINLIKTDLDAGRPIQYAGYSSGGGGGHTWVCDGYDANDQLHMNWGWGGYDDGYFALGSLNGGGSDFNGDNEMLIGIQPLPSAPIDAGVLAVNSPSGIFCSSTFTPSVKIKNYGANTLTSFIINYKIDNNALQTQNWNGSLGSGQSVNVTLAPQTAASGAHTLTCFTSNPNSGVDGNAGNDQSVSSFTVSISGVVLPLIEGMESSANLPTGWSLSNPEGDTGWIISTTVAKTGTHCIAFNNCDGNGNNDMTGLIDRFYTESYDLSTGTASLTFDVAYTPMIYNGSVYSDGLKVYSSSDCGATWNQMYSKSGTTLATAPTSSACWTPSSSEWRNETVNLASLSGQPNVMFAFENISGWGNWLFIDNINISGSMSTGISSANNNETLEIFPNPAFDNLTVKASENISSIQIINMLGKNVISIGQTTELSMKIDITTLPAGVYFVKVTTSDSEKLMKVIKQ